MKHILIFQDFLQTLFFVIKYFMYSTGTVFVWVTKLSRLLTASW